MFPNNDNLKNSKVLLVEYYERPVMGQGKWIGFWTGVERTGPSANLIAEHESECTKWYF